MLIRRWTRIIPVALLVLVIISSGVFAGCSNKSANTPVFSEIDAQILKQAYTEYETLKVNFPLEKAREELVNKLNTQDGVKTAMLGVDGYSIFITYNDEYIAAVDTFDDKDFVSEPAGTSFAPNGTYSKVKYVGTNLSFTANFDKIGDSGFDSLIAYAGTGDKFTTQTKKALILCPKDDTDTTDPTECVTSLKALGWTDSDITLKQNIYPDRLVVKPEQYFNLNNYGVILYFGHGSAKNSFDENQMYIQFCWLTDKEIRDPKYISWLKQGQLAYSDVDEVKGEKRYELLIRGDLLRTIIGKLPSSYVHMSTCYGGYFSKIFLDNGAKVFMSWDNTVRVDYAQSNVTNVLSFMLMNHSANDAYQDDMVIKEATIGKTITAHFRVYASPQTDPSFFYLPAWIKQVTVNGIPKETPNISVSLLDSHGKLLISKDAKGTSSSAIVSGFEETLVPATEKVTIKVEVISNADKTKTTTSALGAGSNSFEITLGSSGLSAGSEYKLVEEALFDMIADIHQTIMTPTDATDDMSAFPVGPGSLYPKYITIQKTLYLYSCDKYGWISQYSRDGNLIRGGAPQ